MKNSTTSPGGEKPRRNSVAKMNLPSVDVGSKILGRSHQRSGVVAQGTLLSSGTRQATVTFPPGLNRKLQLAAAKNGVSLSEMVRQCVARVLTPDE